MIEPEKRVDERGFFARAWCAEELAAVGLASSFVQCNVSRSTKKGTLRGLHYQAAPHGEVKLVRCTRGAVYDVIVDLRPGAVTFKQWFGIELTAENHRLLYVPEGFAHGYQALEHDSEVCYPVTHPYTPAAERGVRWNDPQFGIEWPLTTDVVLSPKDREWPDFKQESIGWERVS